MPHERQNPSFILLGGAPVAGLHVQHHELREGFNKVRLKLDRAATSGDCHVEVAMAREDSGKRVLGCRKSGPEGKRLNVMPCPFIQSALADERVAKVVMNVRAIGLERNRLPVVRYSLIELALLGERIGEVVVRASIIRRQSQRPTITPYRLVDVLLLDEQIAELEVCPRETRIQSERALIARCRFGKPPVALKCCGELAMRGWAFPA